MWLKESCVASVRCDYGSQHTPSPAADIKARKAQLGSAYTHPTHGLAPQATVTVRPPLEGLCCCCFLATQF